MIAGSPLSPADRLERAPRAPTAEGRPKASQGTGFASLLRRGQATLGTAGRHTAASAGSGAAAVDASPAAEPAPTAIAAARPRQRPAQVRPLEDGDAAAVKPGTIDPVPAGIALLDTPALLKKGETDRQAGATPNDDPAGWLAGWHLAQARDAALSTSAGGDEPSAGADARTKHRPSVRALAEGPTEPDAAAIAADAAAPGIAPAPVLQPAVEAGAARRDAVVARETAPSPPLGLPGSAQRAADSASPAPPALAAPVYSPEFAQALGAQVSLFARDGVQQAELRLNPAEMGPIGVRIEIDGTEARVSFSAGLGATREVIERGLPELAAALREQGLTLAGGGVFDQAGDPRQPHGREPFAGGVRATQGGVETPAASVPTHRLPLPQGTLDLYA